VFRARARERRVWRLYARVGEVISAVRMRTQIVEVKDGAPTCVRFDFTEPLSQAHVLTWQGRSIVTMELPKIGESTQLERASVI